MRDSDILTRARALIADERHWCQRAVARDSRGREVGCSDEDAVRFCATGALFRALGSRWTPEAYNSCLGFLGEASRGLYPGSCDVTRPLEWVNNHLGHEAVLKVYDRAIASPGEERT